MVVLVPQVEETGGVGPLRETMAKGSGLPGHEGKRTGRHCTSTGRGAAQSESSALHRLRQTHITQGFSEIERCAVTARGVAQGNARGAARPMPCNASLENVHTLYVHMFADVDFQHFSVSPVAENRREFILGSRK